MTKARKPVIFGTGLIALDVLISDNPEIPVLDAAGGTCGNVLAILSFLNCKSIPIARMNGDPASARVKADLARWGVDLKFSGSEPQAHTPIIVQQLYHTKQGRPRHRFDWVCPKCGERLPMFKPITRSAIEFVGDDIINADVFFMDRLSRGALKLAEIAAAHGAVVYFEPSGIGNPVLFEEALALAHVVKYSNDRLEGLDDFTGGVAPLVEIQTLGAQGLRVRDRLNGRQSKWRSYQSVPAPVLKDTCGAGDWCSAGIISQALSGGLVGLKAGGRKSLDAAIEYGQILAAWNCAFEGARGGMYSVKNINALNREVSIIQSGEFSSVCQLDEALPTSTPEIVDCPACA